MRSHVWFLCSLSLAVSACEQGDYCADVEPNATVTDVLHDDAGGGRLIVGIYHSLSYCTGTDEKRFSNERIEVDLATGAVTVDQRASNVRGPLAMPDDGYPLYQGGNFSSSHCAGCELVLRSPGGVYTYHFTVLAGVFDGVEPAMALDVLEDGAPLAAIDIGGYVSESRASP